MEYKYECGLVVGRFQIFHLGHKSIIDKALEECKTIIVAIGSAEINRTAHDPFTYDERVNLIRSTYSCADLDRMRFMPLVTIGAGDSPVWGNYVVNSCKFLKLTPDAYYTGSEPDRNNWLNNFPEISVEVVDRGIIPISATEIRDKIVANKNTEINQYLPNELISNKTIRKILKEVYKN